MNKEGSKGKSKKGKVEIQRGFVLGYIALGVVVMATGVIMSFSEGAQVKASAESWNPLSRLMRLVFGVGTTDPTAPNRVTISTAQTVGAGDTNLEGKDVVVASGGVLTLAGQHRLKSLTIHDGAVVTHEALTPQDIEADRKTLKASALAKKVDLVVEGTLAIRAGGRIDVTGKGYPGQNWEEIDRRVNGITATNSDIQSANVPGWIENEPLRGYGPGGSVYQKTTIVSGGSGGAGSYGKGGKSYGGIFKESRWQSLDNGGSGGHSSPYGSGSGASISHGSGSAYGQYRKANGMAGGGYIKIQAHLLNVADAPNTGIFAIGQSFLGPQEERQLGAWPGGGGGGTIDITVGTRVQPGVWNAFVNGGRNIFTTCDSQDDSRECWGMPGVSFRAGGRTYTLPGGDYNWPTAAQKPGDGIIEIADELELSPKEQGSNIVAVGGSNQCTNQVCAMAAEKWRNALQNLNPYDMTSLSAGILQRVLAFGGGGGGGKVSVKYQPTYTSCPEVDQSRVTRDAWTQNWCLVDNNNPAEFTNDVLVVGYQCTQGWCGDNISPFYRVGWGDNNLYLQPDISDHIGFKSARKINFSPGKYVFKFDVDEQAEAYLRDSATPFLSATAADGEKESEPIDLTGEQLIRVNYREATGAAKLYFSWEKVGEPDVTPTPTPTPPVDEETPTPTPTPTPPVDEETPTPTPTPTPIRWDPTPTSPTPTPPDEDLSVSLIAIPQSGPAPLNEVALKADFSGLLSGTNATLFFHCNRSDDTTEISPYRKSYTVAPGQTTLTTDWHCGTSESSVYATPGEVTAKVVLRQLVDRQDRRAQATTTITVLPQDTTPTPEPSPDHSIVLRGGYNAVNIPASWGDVRIGFDHFAGSLTIFDFNWFGDENWRPTNNRGKVTEMIPGLGYYIYSPAETTLGVYSVNTGKVPVIKQGWNLLSNSTGEALNVASASFRVIKPDQTNKDCNETGCSEAKTLKQLISAGRGYSVIYELVNPYTANPDEVWRTHEIRPDTADSVKIPANRNFWFYLDRETRWTPWE